MRSILSCVLLALLSACSAEWVNSGGQIADEPVLAQCSQQAAARARNAQMANTGSKPAPQDTSGGALTSQSDVQEQNFFNLCMKERGYSFIPAGPGASR